MLSDAVIVQEALLAHCCSEDRKGQNCTDAKELLLFQNSYSRRSKIMPYINVQFHLLNKSTYFVYKY